MTDAVESLSHAPARPMFTATRFGGTFACLLAGFSIIGAGAYLASGAPPAVKGILFACILFNAGVLGFAGKGGPALMVGLHCLANLVAFSSFVWDLEDDR